MRDASAREKERKNSLVDESDKQLHLTSHATARTGKGGLVHRFGERNANRAADVAGGIDSLNDASISLILRRGLTAPGSIH
jgi:hypothetical protein